MDWFSTVLDLCGIPQPQDRLIDGQSLKSVLGGGDSFDRFVQVQCLHNAENLSRC